MTISPFSSTQRAHYSSQQNGSVSFVLRSAPLGSGTGADILSFTLPINPQAIDIQRPSRQTVTQTLGGAYQDHWGEGLIHISLSGSTGWRPRGPQLLDGYESIIALRKIMHEYDKRCGEGRPADVYLYLLVDLPSKWENFRVSKVSGSYSRTKGSPLLYMYDLSFIALEDLSYLERTNVSPTFVITSYPLKPPPVAGTTTNTNNGTGNGNGNGNNGTGNGNGGALGGNGQGDNDGRDSPDDRGKQDVGDTANDTKKTVTSTVQSNDYYYPLDNLCVTLGALAALWYGKQCWNEPQLLWVFIRDANLDILGADATADTRLVVTTDVHDESYRYQPTKIRMPHLDPGPWNGNARAYETAYFDEKVRRNVVQTVQNAFSAVGTATQNSLNFYGNAIGNFLTQQNSRNQAINNSFSPDNGPSLSSMGPS